MSSKTITIDIISEPLVTRVTNTKGGYDALEIAFKDQGKVSGKKLNSLFQKDIFEQVKGFQRGDRIEVGLEKEAGSDGREYWQWKQVRKLGAGEGTGSTTNNSERSSNGVSEPVVSKEPARSSGKVTGSNYETPEERALKQVLIVRQSSLSAALELNKTNKDSNSLREILDIAEAFVEFVFDAGRLTPPALNVEEAQPAAAQAQETPAPKKPRGRPATNNASKAAAEAQQAIDNLDSDIPF